MSEQKQNEKTKKPFTLLVEDSLYGVQKCVKVNNNGKIKYIPFSDVEIVKCFTSDSGRILGEVQDNGNTYYEQLLILLATLSQQYREKKKTT